MKRFFKMPNGGRYEIPSRIEELQRMERVAKAIGKRYGLSQDQIVNLAIALTETVGNAILHGNQEDPKKKVYITFWLKGDALYLDVRDEGKGFDLTKVEDPTLPENLMKERGRGIFILKNLIDEVSFSFSPHGTTVHMRMHLKNKTP